MAKKILSLAFVLLMGLPSRSNSLPPPFIIKMIIKNALGIYQGSDMIISNNGKLLKLRMSKKYEIFNKKSKLLLKGTSKEINISELPLGKYTIRFEEDPNQIESFEIVKTTQR